MGAHGLGKTLIKHISICNRHHAAAFLPLWVNGELMGRLRRKFADVLLNWPMLFSSHNGGIALHLRGHDLNQRSDNLATLLQELLEQGELSYLHGEQYAMTAGDRNRAVALIDRAAVPYFGIKAFGQHINGFVAKEDGLYMWVARRALDRQRHPGYLDQIAAGGLPYGISLQDNLRKECWEEAGIASERADQAIPVGIVSYNVETDVGFRYDTLYCYDLQLPTQFIPVCQDGEVAGFELLPIDRVVELVSKGGRFKPNCNLVLIDFFIRHGYIKPDDPAYYDLCTGLRPGLSPCQIAH